MDEFNDLDLDSNEIPTDAGNGNLLGAFGTVKEVVNRYLHCVICGSNMHFTHITDFARNTTEENAKCPECGVQAQRSLHKLQ